MANLKIGLGFPLRVLGHLDIGQGNEQNAHEKEKHEPNNANAAIGIDVLAYGQRRTYVGHRALPAR